MWPFSSYMKEVNGQTTPASTISVSMSTARRLSRKLSEQREFGICSSVEEFVQKYSGNRAIKTVFIHIYITIKNYTFI